MLSAVAAMFASSTRVLGVVLAPVLLLMWMESHGILWTDYLSGRGWRKIGNTFTASRNWMVLLIAPLGLLLFMVYLGFKFGDPPLFLHEQSKWGPEIKGIWSILPHDLLRTLTLSASPRTMLNTIAAFLVLLSGVVAWRKYGAGIGLYVLLCVLVPSMSLTDSMIRYVSVIVPSFVILAVWARKHDMEVLVSGVFASISSIAAVLYACGVFVAQAKRGQCVSIDNGFRQFSKNASRCFVAYQTKCED